MPLTVDYFTQLARYSSTLLNQLPIELTPQPLDYSLNKLKPAVEELKESQLAVLNNIPKSEAELIRNHYAQGLNTIGMLADRFSILIIREWCIRNKGVPNTEKADKLYETQTMEIIQALAEAKPGYSSLNSKITNIKAQARANSWEEAFYGLFTTNLILWESQEVLYIKDIQTLPAEEIRDYIKWFSFGNILRNEYMELCEQQYWQNYS